TERLADTRSMRADDVALQCDNFVRRDGDRAKLSDARRHPVDGPSRPNDFLDRLGGVFYAPPSIRRERCRSAVCNILDHLQCQVHAVDLNHTGPPNNKATSWKDVAPCRLTTVSLSLICTAYSSRRRCIPAEPA